jgi:hypothetical protein
VPEPAPLRKVIHAAILKLATITARREITTNQVADPGIEDGSSRGLALPLA